MKTMQKSAGVLTGFAFVALAAALPAQAQVAGECSTRIQIIQTDLTQLCSTGGIGGGNVKQTCDSLASKLSGAQIKLSTAKNGDAKLKLEDFKSAVVAMRDAAKPKISTANAALLLDGDSSNAWDEGDNGAIQCVALLP